MGKYGKENENRVEMKLLMVVYSTLAFAPCSDTPGVQGYKVYAAYRRVAFNASNKQYFQALSGGSQPITYALENKVRIDKNAHLS